MVNNSFKLFLTLYEQLIFGYMPMNFYNSTNYFKIIYLGYYFLKFDFIFSFRVSNSKILFVFII